MIPDNLVIKYHDNGKVSIIYEVNDHHEREGIHVAWYTNGQMRRIAYYGKDNQLHGPLSRWYSNGQLWVKTSYYNDRRHGLLQTWHENGNRYEYANFRHGNKYGIYVVHYPHGELLDCYLEYFDSFLQKSVQIRSLNVADVYNISEQEKTQIALQYGVIL